MQLTLRRTLAVALSLASALALNACIVRSQPGYVQTGYVARPAPVVYTRPAPVVYAQPAPVVYAQPAPVVYVR